MPHLRILAFALGFCITASAQTFEVASIRLSDPAMGNRGVPVKGGPGTSDPTQVTYTNISLRALLYYAYGMAGKEIEGPPWLADNKFDITAKIPPGTTKDSFAAMLRNLLGDRFHFEAHHESRETPGYDLVVGKTGPKLTKYSGDLTPPDGPVPDTRDAKGYMQLDRPGMIYPFVQGSNNQAIHLIAKGQSLSDLTRILGGLFGHPIVDKTNLTGRYDFTLEFALETSEPNTDEDRIPDALQHQLGLQLESSKIAIDVLVVDHADRLPSAN